MFQQTKTPVLGLVENMSHFNCPACGHDTPIFDQGGGAAVAEREGVGFLGAIPLDPVIRQGGDAGAPVVASSPESPQARAFAEAAERLWAAVQAASAAPV
jgi:ATP-binding protein involved in chromosome partitioning